MVFEVLDPYIGYHFADVGINVPGVILRIK